MPGEVNLETLIMSIRPKLSDEDYIFSTMNAELQTIIGLTPWAIIQESEGPTIIIEKTKAIEYTIPFESTFRRITLHVHSSLNAIGLTAVISTTLKDLGISANVVAGYYHDHFFVQSEYGERALTALQKLSADIGMYNVTK